LKVLRGKDPDLPKKQVILLACCLWVGAVTLILPWVSSFLAYLADVGLSSLHIHMNQFLKTNKQINKNPLSLSLSLSPSLFLIHHWFLLF
jgi:hypothetical protein